MTTIPLINLKILFCSSCISCLMLSRRYACLYKNRRNQNINKIYLTTIPEYSGQSTKPQRFIISNIRKRIGRSGYSNISRGQKYYQTSTYKLAFLRNHLLKIRMFI